jgi:hypothetical protein
VGEHVRVCGRTCRASRPRCRAGLDPPGEMPGGRAPNGHPALALSWASRHLGRGDDTAAWDERQQRRAAAGWLLLRLRLRACARRCAHHRGHLRKDLRRPRSAGVSNRAHVEAVHRGAPESVLLPAAGATAACFGGATSSLVAVSSRTAPADPHSQAVGIVRLRAGGPRRRAVRRQGGRRRAGDRGQRAAAYA